MKILSVKCPVCYAWGNHIVGDTSDCGVCGTLTFHNGHDKTCMNRAGRPVARAHDLRGIWFHTESQMVRAANVLVSNNGTN